MECKQTREIPNSELPTSSEVNVRAASLFEYLFEWSGITSNNDVLSIVKGYSLPFINNSVPAQISEPPQPIQSEVELANMEVCIQKLLRIQAVKLVPECKGQFISSVFLVPKPDGSHRFILNLKRLNEYLVSPHFKMEDQRTVQKLLCRNDFMAKIDLKDAYYLIKIKESHQKYLRFRFRNNIYEFCCMPFGLTSAPRVFTKLLKPVIHILRKQKIKSVIYLDDFLIMNESYENCLENIRTSISLLERLGFVVNYKKSVLTPVRCIEYLGFTFNSCDLTIALPERKITKINQMINSVLNKVEIKVIELAKLIGTLVAAIPAIPYSMLYIRHLERIKLKALKVSKNDYESKVIISEEAREEIIWWQTNIHKVNHIRNDCFQYQLDTDSSKTGWGATTGVSQTRGYWNAEEKALHINTLEIIAAYNGLRTFFSKQTNIQILLRIDSTTAIAYINRYGGIRSPINHSWASRIWKWCMDRNIFIYATYIHTTANYVADKLSRLSVDENDFSLDNIRYNSIVDRFGTPNIDLFATSKTTKCQKFVSWFPDPLSTAVDAFTIKWSDYFYAFPPFSLLNRVIKKIKDDGAVGIVVAPMWESQSWYPVLCEIMVEKPMILKPNTFVLYDPYCNRCHPLQKSLTLMAAKVSGRRKH